MTTKIPTIERDIPIPKPGRPCDPYPWEQLQIGDSFFMPKRVSRSVDSLCRYHGKRLHRKFICRQMWHEGVFGVRVWRVPTDEDIAVSTLPPSFGYPIYHDMLNILQSAGLSYEQKLRVLDELREAVKTKNLAQTNFRYCYDHGAP